MEDFQVCEQCTSCDECGMLISGVASLHNMHGICHKLGMPGFRCLVIGFSVQRHGLERRAVCVGFVDAASLE